VTFEVGGVDGIPLFTSFSGVWLDEQTPESFKHGKWQRFIDCESSARLLVIAYVLRLSTLFSPNTKESPLMEQ